MTATAAVTSVAPDGTSFSLPSDAETATTLARIAEAAEAHRRAGGTVVAVQGLGFVGSAVCAALTLARRADGRPAHLVVGIDLATPDAYWKIGKVAGGEPPVASPDAELAAALAAGVADGVLWATAAPEAYGLADVIVVDVDLGVAGRLGGTAEPEIELASFERAVRSVGREMRADALVVIETTLPVGTCRRVVLPALADERERRGIDRPVLVANAYERVMPGPRYLESVRAFPRSFAGLESESARRARAFLTSFVDGERAPLRELDSLEAAELGKLLENSYRAANIAFVHEWTQLAESVGVDLWTVLESIRVRSGTHDNIRNPGLGVGGYCLTKDSLLAQWGVANLFGSDVVLEMTLDALETNLRMPLHTFAHVLALGGGELSGRTIAVLGVAYLPDVADTRNSPSETLVRELVAAGADVRAHDPHVRQWRELPETPLFDDLVAVLEGVDGIVIAVAHSAYRQLSAAELQRVVGGAAFLVDAQNVVDNETAGELHRAGWRVSGVGKGHWRAAGYGTGT